MFVTSLSKYRWEVPESSLTVHTHLTGPENDSAAK